MLALLATPSSVKGQVLAAQGTTTSATTYAFTPSAGLINIAPLYESDATFNKNNTNVIDFSNASYPTFSLGTFVNNNSVTYSSGGSSTALQLSYQLYADSSDLGAVAIIFDTGANGKIDDGGAFRLSGGNQEITRVSVLHLDDVTETAKIHYFFQ